MSHSLETSSTHFPLTAWTDSEEREEHVMGRAQALIPMLAVASAVGNGFHFV